MNIVAIVLLVLLVLFFLLFAFLSVFRAETKRYKALRVSAGFFYDGSQALTLQKLRERHFEEVTLPYRRVPNQEHFLRSPVWRLETSFSHGLSGRRDLKMNTENAAKKQDEAQAHSEIIESDREQLASAGFTSDEIVSLLWLQKWYQSGGSDSVELVRHWEFFRFLVRRGELDV
jgi:hypothetical protein